MNLSDGKTIEIPNKIRKAQRQIVPALRDIGYSPYLVGGTVALTSAVKVPTGWVVTEIVL